MKFSGFISASIDNSAKFHVIYRSDHIVSRGGANPHLEKSAPTYKLNPHLAPATSTPSTRDGNPQPKKRD